MRVKLLVIGEKEGRPTKLDEPMAAKICEGLSYGLTNQQTADLAGISASTLHNWLEDEVLAHRVAGARAQRDLVRLKRIENGDAGWQGCAWLLERSNPQLWGRHLLYQRAEPTEKVVSTEEVIKKILG